LNVQVFGVPDKHFGEEVAAWIKLEEGSEVSENDIFNIAKKNSRIRKSPATIKFVKEFPMTLLGKVQEFKMREIAMKEYGLE
jgi:fatty-acyl-CoA synthase